MLRMRRSLLAPVLAAVLACQTPEDCSLNGACTPSGCACVAPWAGAACGQLDFLPAPAPAHLSALVLAPNASTWCASTLRDDSTGAYHAVFSLFAGGCGLNSWVANSQLMHATASSPTGPFAAANATLLRLPFAHNPKLTRAPDGTYLVFHIGCGDNATHRYGPCAGGVTPLPPPPPALRFTRAGGCLAPAGGAFPAWVSPLGRPVSPLALAHGAPCNTSASGWLPDRANNRLYSAAWPTATAVLDCASCAAGAPATLTGPSAAQGQGATGFVFNKSTGAIEVAGCPGMCLSSGGSGALRPRCDSNASEPWSPQQLHLVPCSQAEAQGWVEERGAQGGRGAAPPRTCGGGFTELLSAPSLQGPWAFSTAFGPSASGGFPYSVDNPSPLFFPNGSALVMFRSYLPYRSQIGVARGESWRGPWALPLAPAFEGLAEDPFLWWQASTQSFHALLHGLGACGGVGCHAFSRDGWAWTVGAEPAYGLSVAFEGGSNVTFGRRERPHLIVDAQGRATHLINGVELPHALQPPAGQRDASISIAVPLRV